MARLENLKAYNPFDDTTEGEDTGPGDQGLVHIRIQQRNGRKTLTTVQGLSSEYDFKKIVKVAKNACNIIKGAAVNMYTFSFYVAMKKYTSLRWHPLLII